MKGKTSSKREIQLDMKRTLNLWKNIFLSKKTFKMRINNNKIFIEKIKMEKIYLIFFCIFSNIIISIFLHITDSFTLFIRERVLVCRRGNGKILCFLDVTLPSWTVKMFIFRSDHSFVWHFCINASNVILFGVKWL
jgi:hypothetical protein